MGHILFLRGLADDKLPSCRNLQKQITTAYSARTWMDSPDMLYQLCTLHLTAVHVPENLLTICCVDAVLWQTVWHASAGGIQCIWEARMHRESGEETQCGIQHK